MLKHLVIVRGLPCVDKDNLLVMLSTFGFDVVSAETFMKGQEEKYEFIPDKVNSCDESVNELANFFISGGHNVVVSNSFEHESDFKDLVDYATLHDYSVNIIVVENRSTNIDPYCLPDDFCVKKKEQLLESIIL